MLYTNAIFRRKDTEIEAKQCVVDKVIRLTCTEFDRFSNGLLRDWDFIRFNQIDTVVDKEGRYHCLLVISEDRRDGILVNSEGGDYALYTAFVPNVDGLLTVGQYPALAALNKKLTEIVDYIVEEMNIEKEVGDYIPVDLLEVELMFDISITDNDVVLSVITGMLNEKPEIADWELKDNVIFVCDGPVQTAEDLSDPSVTLTDMYAQGYGYEDMIPLGTERALELFDKGHEIFRLYLNGFELATNSRHDIEVFDGLLGVKNPAHDKPARPASIEAFIVNRARFEKNDIVGEWLILPADANTLQGLLERIDIDTPGVGAFSVAAVRMPYDCMREYVTKYDSLDEINMLASFMHDMESYELDKLQAILTSGVEDIGSGISDLINTLCEENFDAFRMADATDYESLGRYWEDEANDKPEELSFEEYGRQIVADEEGKFTEWGYIYFRYKELLPEYDCIVPDEYKIVGAALQGLRSKQTERGESGGKPSVVERIKAARQSPALREKDTRKNNKGGPEH